MVRVMWCSRHSMTERQEEDLQKLLGGKIEVIADNVTWAASEDPEEDRDNNIAAWDRLAAGVGRRGVIAGVFPPVAMEVIGRAACMVMIVSPVSRQAPELRVGEGPIPFEHVRWAILA